MDLVRDAKCVYAASIKLFYIIIPQKKWNPSLRTPLKLGHLSNKDIFPPQNHTIFQSQK